MVHVLLEQNQSSVVYHQPYMPIILAIPGAHVARGLPEGRILVE